MSALRSGIRDMGARSQAGAPMARARAMAIARIRAQQLLLWAVRHAVRDPDDRRHGRRISPDRRSPRHGIPPASAFAGDGMAPAEPFGIMGLKNAFLTACFATSVVVTALPAYAAGPTSAPAARPSAEKKASHPFRVASRSTVRPAAAKVLGSVEAKTRETADANRVVKVEPSADKTAPRGIAAKDFKGTVPDRVLKLAQGADKTAPTLVRVVKVGEGTAFWFEKEARIAPTGIFLSSAGEVSAVDLMKAVTWGH